MVVFYHHLEQKVPKKDNLNFQGIICWLQSFFSKNVIHFVSRFLFFSFPYLNRGVAVDDQGYICVADSGNNRIQIFHPDGSFLRAFGSWGSGDAEFKGLEGVAIMSNGNILVCDRENHRVQVF